MPATIKAAICRAFGEPLVIEDVTLADPGPGEVMVAVKACGICHSDITYAEGGWGGTLPMVLGHEAAGVVSAVGDGVTAFKPGDRVIATLIRSCDRCGYCASDRTFLCEEIFPLDKRSPLTSAKGETLTHAMRTGAFAEAVTVHESQVVAIPDTLGFDAASLLACGVLTGFGAVTNTAAMPAGSHAVVVGCGGVGLNALQGARHAQAASVTAIDLDDGKLETARGYGATHVANPRNGKARDIIMGATGNHGADYVFVTVGAGAAIEGAHDWLAVGGTVVIVGMPNSDVMTKFNPSSLAGWAQTIKGSKMGSANIRRDIPALIALHDAGKLELEAMISGRYRLDAINEAIASTKSGKALRNVIVFD